MWIPPVRSCTSLRSSSIGNVVPSLRRPTDSAERSLLSCGLQGCRLRPVAGVVGGELRADHQRERLADRLLLAVAEQLGRRAIERLDHPVAARPSRCRPPRSRAPSGCAPRCRGTSLGHASAPSSRDLRNSSTKIETFARRMSGTIGAKMKSTAPLAYAVADLRVLGRVRGDEDDRRVLVLGAHAGSAWPSRSRPCPASARPSGSRRTTGAITARSAASPESASTIAWPSGSRIEPIASRLPGLSSTTRIARGRGSGAGRGLKAAPPGSAAWRGTSGAARQQLRRVHRLGDVVRRAGREAPLALTSRPPCR